MLKNHRTPTSVSGGLAGTALLLSLGLAGCANGPIPPVAGIDLSSFLSGGQEESTVCAADAARLEAEQAELFRQAETERAEQLTREIARLQADLKTAESALVEVESGLAGSSGRADAVSSLAVTRIQVERAASQAPWREVEIAIAREKLDEGERQVREGRFGAALFFVYRARRVAESILAEAEDVLAAGNARLIQAKRVNLRAGPSTDQRILSVLESGTPVIPQASEGDWRLVQVTGGPAGWIHESLLGVRVEGGAPPPASKRP